MPMPENDREPTDHERAERIRSLVANLHTELVDAKQAGLDVKMSLDAIEASHLGPLPTSACWLSGSRRQIVTPAQTQMAATAIATCSKGKRSTFLTSVTWPSHIPP